MHILLDLLVRNGGGVPNGPGHLLNKQNQEELWLGIRCLEIWRPPLQVKASYMPWNFPQLFGTPGRGHPVKHCQAANPFSRCPGYSAASFSALLVWNPTPGTPFSSDTVIVHSLEETLARNLSSQEVQTNLQVKMSNDHPPLSHSLCCAHHFSPPAPPIPTIPSIPSIPTSCGTSPLWNTFCAKV